MKSNKTITILLGAGAAMPWDAPSSQAILHELICDTSFLNSSRTKSLFETVRDLIAEFYNSNRKKEINFEHVFNNMEMLASYFYEQSDFRIPQFHGTSSLWFDINKENYSKLSNFETSTIENDNERVRLYNNTATNQYLGEYPKRVIDWVYFNKAIEHYLEIVRRLVLNYDRNSITPKHEGLNDKFYCFYKQLKECGFTVRIYTTNYDILFQRILEEKFNNRLFFGFEDGFHGNSKPDIKRILSDFESDCYYNLHGSIYWKYNYDQISTQYFEYTHCYSSNPVSVGKTIDQGKYSLIHNIVTGFNKTSKINIEPLNAFYSTLMRDCANSDFIATIGYSYGDIHINSALKNGPIHNNAKLLHITKNDDFAASHEYIEMQNSTLGKNKVGDLIEQDNFLKSGDNQVYIYNHGFNRFLENSAWKNLDLKNV